jgi:hypothetical protein
VFEIGEEENGGKCLGDKSVRKVLPISSLRLFSLITLFFKTFTNFSSLLVLFSLITLSFKTFIVFFSLPK